MSRRFRAGELAAAAGISKDSLRFYERKGLLPAPPRTTSGYRQYPPAALDRVLLIRRALSLGISVAELEQLLRVRAQGGAPCRRARALLVGKLEELEERLEELRELRQVLRDTLEDWDSKLAKTPPGTQARLLESTLQTPQTRRTDGKSDQTSSGSVLSRHARSRRG
jgi:MerR family transcriptional regulator, copper efflux regulator